MILAGDVGGTKTRLALYESTGATDGKLVRKVVETVSSKEGTFPGIVGTFLARHKVSPSAACFGIPGPVIDGRVKVTNLPWELDSREIQRELNIPKLKLVNDLVSTVAAIPHFQESDLVVLHPGNPKRDRTVSAMVAPGTGMGQAYIVSVNGHHYPLPSEGGHVNFSPTAGLEIELLQHLLKKHSRVSAERVICGPGIVNIYEFLRDNGHGSEDPAIAARMKQEDAAAVIAQAGLSGDSSLCSLALDLFAVMLGSKAGDLMLTYMATGGIYLGGGIPPKILPKLREHALKGYFNKGRLTPAVQEAPLYVVKDDHAALLGAAHIAQELVHEAV